MAQEKTPRDSLPGIWEGGWMGGVPGFGDSWQATVSPPSGAGQRRPWSLEADSSGIWAEGHARDALQLPTLHWWRRGCLEATGGSREIVLEHVPLETLQGHPLSTSPLFHLLCKHPCGLVAPNPVTHFCF